MNEALLSIPNPGWRWIWDSDCLFPDEVDLERLQIGKLHGCRRRVLEDPNRWRPSLDWANCPHARDGNCPIGFTQIFHSEDPQIAGEKQLYDVSFPHGGGSDAYFIRFWPPQLHRMLGFDVLHLGRVDMNWMGADQEGRDMMARYVYDNGWRRAMCNHTPESAARGAPLPPRLRYEGYAETGFEMLFERRGRERREQEARG